MEHLSITFPENLRRELDREARREHTKRSSLIQKAVRVYLAMKRRRQIGELLKEGYLATGEESKQILRDFGPLDEESLKYVD